ncbi:MULTISPECIES: hypothetical protein [unclassified Novosphingobium]|nr:MULTISPECIES: hypothetical protein [unclassified Novosphingobium]GFM27996.1 uncharacterized protein PY1_contig-04-44 [Novosphingobium sp. PY1]
MAQVIALARTIQRPNRAPEVLRTAIVAGCALALILAKAPLPF